MSAQLNWKKRNSKTRHVTIYQLQLIANESEIWARPKIAKIRQFQLLVDLYPGQNEADLEVDLVVHVKRLSPSTRKYFVSVKNKNEKRESLTSCKMHYRLWSIWQDLMILNRKIYLCPSRPKAHQWSPHRPHEFHHRKKSKRYSSNLVLNTIFPHCWPYHLFALHSTQ